MAKVLKSVRVTEEDAARVLSLKGADETESAAYARVIHAGIESLEDDGRDTEGAGAGASPTSSADDSAALVEELRSRIGDLQGRIEDLRTQVDVLTLQLDRKDEQIAARDAQVTAFTYTTQRALLASAEAEERDGEDVEDVEDVSQDDGDAASTTTTQRTFRERVAALFRHDR